MKRNACQTTTDHHTSPVGTAELCRAYSALIALGSSWAEITLTLHRLPAICNPYRVQVYLMKIIAWLFDSSLYQTHVIKILELIKTKKIYKDGFVFSLCSRSTIYSDLKELAKNANIDKHITFHVSRITFVTLSISAGINIFVISKLCGHHDIKTTQIYTRLLDTTYINAIETFENIFINK